MHWLSNDKDVSSHSCKLLAIIVENNDTNRLLKREVQENVEQAVP